MEWVDANLGSKLTMKYPSCYLLGPGAHGEILSMAFAGKGQHQDAGGKVIHVAPHTSSKVTSKSISMGGGRASYRGLLKVHKDANDSRSNVVCDALLLDDKSRSDTYPYIEIDEEDVTIGHEASVSKIGEEQLFYLIPSRTTWRRTRPATSSTRGHLKDRSRSVWQGMIYVAPRRSEDGWLPGKPQPDPQSEGRADSIPGLEILADDVRCTHGATVGKIDPELVFYLKARGIPQADAERLVVEGFFDPIMQRIPYEGVRTRFLDAIQEKLR